MKEEKIINGQIVACQNRARNKLSVISSRAHVSFKFDAILPALPVNELEQETPLANTIET